MLEMNYPLQVSNYTRYDRKEPAYKKHSPFNRKIKKQKLVFSKN